MKPIDRLTQLCRPPAIPLSTLTLAQWNTQFRAIGTRLPQELVQIHSTFGSGFFQSLKSPSNGSFGLHATTVAAAAIGRLAELRLAKLKYPNAFDVRLYFEPDGLLPVGWVAADIDLCLRVTGDNPDRWPVSLVRAKSRKVHHLDESLLAVVTALVAGELTSDLFSPHLPNRHGYRFESAVESVAAWHAG